MFDSIKSIIRVGKFFLNILSKHIILSEKRPYWVSGSLAVMSILIFDISFQWPGVELFSVLCFLYNIVIHVYIRLKEMDIAISVY